MVMFKHWFEDDPDFVDKDPIKTRENELHKPKTDTRWNVPYFYATAFCAVCGKKLREDKNYFEEQAINKVLEECPNYCPHCGARLKEVDNG